MGEQKFLDHELYGITDRFSGSKPIFCITSANLVVAVRD
jgi:hypothetical protein